MIKRRTLWIAPTILTMLGVLGFCSIDWLKVEEMRAKPNTLRNRVLAYERKMQTDNHWPSDNQISDDITKIMESYFKLGMSEEECVKILGANDLRVDEKGKNNTGYRNALNTNDYSLVSRVELTSGVDLITLRYRLIFRFVDGRLTFFEGVRVTTGP